MPRGQYPRRSLHEILEHIEITAKNHLLPRSDIVKLCGEARKSTVYKYEHGENPIRVAVQKAIQGLKVDKDGVACMPDGEYMTTLLFTPFAGVEVTHANLARVGKALVAIGFVRLSRTRIYPSARWFVPSALL